MSDIQKCDTLVVIIRVTFHDRKADEQPCRLSHIVARG